MMAVRKGRQMQLQLTALIKAIEMNPEIAAQSQKGQVTKKLS